MSDVESLKQDYQTRFSETVKGWAQLRQGYNVTLVDTFTSNLQAFQSWSQAKKLTKLHTLLGELSEVLSSETNTLSGDAIGAIDQLLNKLIVASRDKHNSYLEVLKDSQLLPAKSRVNTYVAIIDDSELARLSTKAMLDRFNFDVELYESIDAFKSSPKAAEKTDIVLLDVVMPDTTEDDVFEFAAELRQQQIHIILVSGNDSIDLRLKAVRSDIGGYVTKPFDINVLVSNIHWICNLDIERPFHVVLLDDQASVGQYLGDYAKSLSIEFTYYTSSTEFIDGLDSAIPDLFLLDVNLPEISGMEVCKILRQQKRFDYVPIVFLSSDDSLETKLEALTAGADDVIIKHNPPDIIFKQVEKRVVRGQRIRAMAVKDSLTGLLNHGQLMDAAASAFRLARRNNTNITVAMIDIDNFKQINDTHGHLVGDNVIVGLAQLLKTSIRDTDVAGRYGGEEFIVIFYSEDIAAIEQKLETLLKTFGQLKFSNGNTLFSCTFSCGMATAQTNESFKDVINRADKVMYEVKRNGKNAVRVAP